MSTTNEATLDKLPSPSYGCSPEKKRRWRVPPARGKLEPRYVAPLLSPQHTRWERRRKSSVGEPLREESSRYAAVRRPEKKKRAVATVASCLEIVPWIPRGRPHRRIDVPPDASLIIRVCRIWHQLSWCLVTLGLCGYCRIPKGDVLLQGGEGKCRIVPASLVAHLAGVRDEDAHRGGASFC